ADRVREAAEAAAEKRLVSLLLGEESDSHRAKSQAPVGAPAPSEGRGDSGASGGGGWVPSEEAGWRNDAGGVVPDEHDRVRARMLEKLREGVFEDREIEITVREK